MNRRDVIKAFAGGVASVAIGLKLSQGMPKLPEPTMVIPMTVKITFDNEVSWADWRVAYGTPVECQE